MMKNFWKTLGAVSLAAAVIPVQIKKDEQAGKKSFQSLLWKLNVEPSEHDNTKTKISLDLMEGVLTAPLTKAITAKKETALFADDEPEAAVVPNVIDFSQDADEDLDAEEEAEAAVDEVQATEEDFDPEM